MDPITAAILVGSAGAQWYNGEQGRKDRKATEGRIEDLYRNLQLPQFDMSIYDQMIKEGYTPEQINQMIQYEDYQYAGDLNPTLAAYFQEANPNLVQDGADTLQGREAIQNALSKYKGVAEGGYDPELEAALADIRNRNMMDAKSQRDSVLQNFSRRGQLGTSQMLVAQMQGNQDQQMAAAAASRDAAVAAYKNRLNALDQSAALGGQMMDRDYRKNYANANFINDFNARTAKAFNANIEGNTDRMNRAGEINKASTQNWLDNNTEVRNQQVIDRARMTVNERDRIQDARMGKNSMIQQEYNNRLAQVNGMAGRMGNNMENSLQDRRDQNQMIQGLGDGIIGGMRQSRQDDFNQKYLDAYNQRTLTNNGKYSGY